MVEYSHSKGTPQQTKRKGEQNNDYQQLQLQGGLHDQPNYIGSTWDGLVGESTDIPDESGFFGSRDSDDILSGEW
jgi:hypothetical protein